ncbi:hypothetical protein BCV72DRAFT_18098 [Rhizopus microsporus var. microsporus]|uniref:Rho-GAP domain-containing protein n=2 Tax=Rhizopus microsporus TaxID=58291 RepID=A0A2G4T4X7_RHIZD|nr:uncharacterized protein RHIMIDRAFT_233678 [Rhizopus microsporus ATCC 52813]ORE04250.1 hypothetical protein BCV72DRAFT_18098 [Rhizopus microsporus var. microsporus]PHZ16074.1 hypothetical protein RHIMIDRAFT_233678 [Rhizopus microsporus ATCC 52813]
MYYSFDFIAKVTRLCIEEIRQRGFQERKIFRKTVPNYGLFIKIFNKRDFTANDLSYVDIHSVATLMQVALWSTPDRIISKKAWRKINYETCTLSNLSSIIPNKSQQLLIEILDFLVELLQHKHVNLMDAYKLGDSLGKVVLGPSDCSQIMEEKSGHFLTRLIIEHAKITSRKSAQSGLSYSRTDSGYDMSSVYSSVNYMEYQPLCKTEGTRARAKCYSRIIAKINRNSSDWVENADGIQSMMDNDYDIVPEPPEKPWISIFVSPDSLRATDKDMRVSSSLYRILNEAVKAPAVVPEDPFEASFLFNKTKACYAEHQIHEAFNQFLQLQTRTDQLTSNNIEDKANPLRKLNSSLSNLKLNIRRYRSRVDLLEDSAISEDTVINESNVTDSENINMHRHQHHIHYVQQQQQQQPSHNHHHQHKSGLSNMKGAMRKMAKIAGDRKISKILI